MIRQLSRQHRSPARSDGKSGKSSAKVIDRARYTLLQITYSRHEAPIPDDQFGASRPKILQMQIDLMTEHLAFAAEHRRHVDRDGAGHHAERWERQVWGTLTPSRRLG